MSAQPGAGGQLGYELPPWFTQMQQSNLPMPAPQAPQMPWAQQFQFPEAGGAPQQLPGLMANPSAFQFIQGMMDQPGGSPGGLPGYGTPWAGGIPAWMQMHGNLRQPREVIPPPNTGGGGGGGVALPSWMRREDAESVGGGRGGDRNDGPGQRSSEREAGFGGGPDW